jgi:hypothetical protein
MRFDNIGMFWEDRAPEKPPKKEKPKPIPPNRVWLEPDYLPHLDEAAAFVPNLYTDDELLEAHRNKEMLAWDVESYPNYFGIGFLGIKSGKALVFERDDQNLDFDSSKLRWVLENFTLIDFNGENYDRWVAAIACTGATAKQCHSATVEIIEQNERGWRVAKSRKAPKLKLNHIDLIELTALAPSLKTMAGRLHSPFMMDLPFQPGTTLSYEQKLITKWYNFNDLNNTLLLYKAHAENIKLRELFGPKYRVDLRSDSDAQIAEAIFRSEVLRRTGRHVGKNRITPGRQFYFQIPEYVKFYTPNLQWVLDLIRQAKFTINEYGYVKMPDELADLVIPIGSAHYKMGIGGLHSQEKRAAHVAGDQFIIRDFDVGSYYPKLILGTGLEPPLLRGLFRPIYAAIVDQRLHAKAAGDTVAADGLKIVVNGSFGKTLDPHSCLYFPELGIQTTLGGQLSLLMAIELLDMAGIQVINANTDGIVVKCPKEKEHTLSEVFAFWEKQTGLEMEKTDYKAVFSRDVNSYVAFYEKEQKGKYAKGKGVFAVGDLKHNPRNDICATAVMAYLHNKTPVEQTVMQCRDIRQFVEIRNVQGGGAKVWPDGSVEYIGKVARWYHSTEVTGAIVTAKKGHVVASSEGGRPCMRLPDQFPEDLDFSWYIQESYDLLDKIGYNDLFNPQPETVAT